MQTEGSGVIIASCVPNESPKLPSPLSSYGIYKRARRPLMPSQKLQSSCIRSRGSSSNGDLTAGLLVANANSLHLKVL